MTASKRPTFPWLLSLLALALMVLLISLGVWQVQRLSWKEGLIRSAEGASGQPVLTLDEALKLADPEFRRVVMTCRGLALAPFVELQTIEQKQMGVRLISACDAGEASLLVDRGFVAEEVKARPPVDAKDDMPVVVTGVLRRAPEPGAMTPKANGSHFYGRDLKAMGEALAVSKPVLELMVFAETQTNPEFTALVPSVPAVAFSNNHLGYALTWFGLAIALIVFYLVLLRRRLRKDN